MKPTKDLYTALWALVIACLLAGCAYAPVVPPLERDPPPTSDSP